MSNHIYILIHNNYKIYVKYIPKIINKQALFKKYLLNWQVYNLNIS